MATTQFFVIVTVQRSLPGGHGYSQATVTFTPDVGPEATRSEIFQWVMENLPENLRGGTVLFFSAEPNAFTLPASAPASVGGDAR